MTFSLRKYHSMLICLCLIASPSPVLAEAVADLKQLLNQFLAGVTDADTHNRFWAEDLIYTSSRGTRTTKAEIMAGFDVTVVQADDGGPSYTAEDVQIQVYDDTAVVAFRLVATPPDGTQSQEYLNTGTFLRRDGKWQAVAWQATIIPGTIISETVISSE